MIKPFSCLVFIISCINISHHLQPIYILHEIYRIWPMHVDVYNSSYWCASLYVHVHYIYLLIFTFKGFQQTDISTATNNSQLTLSSNQEHNQAIQSGKLTAKFLKFSYTLQTLYIIIYMHHTWNFMYMLCVSQECLI